GSGATSASRRSRRPRSAATQRPSPAPRVAAAPAPAPPGWGARAVPRAPRTRRAGGPGPPPGGSARERRSCRGRPPATGRRGGRRRGGTPRRIRPPRTRASPCRTGPPRARTGRRGRCRPGGRRAASLAVLQLVPEPPAGHPPDGPEVGQAHPEPPPVPVLRGASAPRPVRHRDLRHPESLDLQERGQEAVHAAVEAEPQERLPAERLEGAAGVVHALPGQPAPDAVPAARGDPLGPGVAPVH